MNKRPNIQKIAAGLGAENRGTVRATGGWFGAVQLAHDVSTRFQAPKGGGRRTDPAWTERRLIPLSAASLMQLGQVAEQINTNSDTHIEPLQLAGILLEKALVEAKKSPDSVLP